MSKLNAASVVVRKDNIMATPVDDEMVMMHLESNRYFGINAIGRRIWELIETPTAVTAVCQQLMSEFDVDADTCQREVLAFLGEMADSNVIDLAAPPS